jgi:hypothetical protein
MSLKVVWCLALMIRRDVGEVEPGAGDTAEESAGELTYEALQRPQITGRTAA